MRRTELGARILFLACGLCLAWCQFALAEQNLTGPLLTGREARSWLVTSLSWSPDGSQIAFELQDFDLTTPNTLESSDQNIWIVDRGGRTVRNLTNFPSRIVTHVPTVVRDVPRGLTPAWSPSSIDIAFEILDLSVPSPAQGQLAIVTTNGLVQTITALPFILHFLAPPSWSPDGNLLVFDGADLNDPARGLSPLYLVNPNGSSTPRKLTGFGLGQSFSPDGSQIIFQRWTRFDPGTGEVHYQIFKINVNGTGETPLSDPSEDASSPAWAPLDCTVPDPNANPPVPPGPCHPGQKIAYICDSDICIVSEAGTNRVRLPNNTGGQVENLNWSPDGSRIAFNTTFSANRKIFVINANGTRLEQWSNGENDSSPVWAPDGNVIAYLCPHEIDLRFFQTDICLTRGKVTPPPSTPPPPALCSPSNCNGCCGSDNKCHLGRTNDACGVGGFQCSVCGASEVCDAAALSCQLKPGAGLCGPSNCNGCCGSDNKCHLGRTNDACGFGGFQCSVCAASEACKGGAGPVSCQLTPGAGLCGPSNCNGCCDFNGVCHSGVRKDFCGGFGTACEACVGAQVCDLHLGCH